MPIEPKETNITTIGSKSAKVAALDTILDTGKALITHPVVELLGGYWLISEAKFSQKTTEVAITPWARYEIKVDRFLPSDIDAMHVALIAIVFLQLTQPSLQKLMENMPEILGKLGEGVQGGVNSIAAILPLLAGI